MRQALSLPAGGVALVLVDLQEEHRRDARYLVEGFESVLQNAARLLAVARATGAGVLHAAYVRDFARTPPRPHEPRGADGAPAFSDPAGALTAICPEVAPGTGETVFEKDDASAFAGAGFAEALAGMAPEWLIVAGVWTEACIAATVRDAMAAGLRVLLVKDACGSGSAHMHETATLHLANRLYGGGVADTDRALRLLSGDAADVWQVRSPVPIRFTAQSVRDEFDAL
ncbi:isochorismatase family protein [Rhodobacterales bacterium HKCCE2091]|nr:isochorismatase family protein [Rhodobacterales bacterium HKCCE2091]